MWGFGPLGSVPWGAPGTVRATSYTETIADSIEVTEAVVETLVNVIREIARVQASIDGRADLTSIIADSVEARDAAIRVLSELIAESVSSQDTITGIYAAITTIMDAVVATGAVSTSIEAQNAIVEAIYAAARMYRSFPETVAEAVSLADALQHTQVAAVLLVDQIAAADNLADTLTVTSIAADAVQASDSMTHLIEALNSISEQVQCVVTFVIDGQVYTGVVINPKGGAASEYTNWPINSGFHDLDGKDYGVAKDGIYLLEGDDDDGEAIDSYVRSGLLAIAGGIRARVPDAYIGVSADGDLIVKATVVNDDGSKGTHWYKAEKREGTAPRNTRVKIGRGLVADRWQIELHSVDGSAFRNLDSIKLRPLRLSRRIG